jgi:vacuolar-type H+-ATPase subunit H
MFEEALQRLEAAEREAEEIIAEAKKQASEILLKLAEEKEVLHQELIEEAVREAEKLRLQAIALARKREEIFLEELERKIATKRKLFDKKKEKLVNLVLRWLEEEWL